MSELIKECFSSRTAPRHPHAMLAEEKRPFVQDLFTSIAPRYDWFNRLASCGMDQGWRRAAVTDGRVGPGLQVLDLCAGTGDLAFLCAQRVGKTGKVIGADMNRAMLTYAQKKAAGKEFAVDWLQADALALPFAAATFDRITIGFSTRNLTDLTSGLREMLRTLKPGGRLIVLETGRPSQPIVRLGYYLFLQTFARALGWILTGKTWPFTYLARSVEQFVSPQEFTAVLESLGAQATFRPLSGGLVSLFIATKSQAA